MSEGTSTLGNTGDMADTGGLADWLASLARRKFLIVFLVLASAASAAVVSKLLTPVYEAKAVFYLMNEVNLPSSVDNPKRRRAMVPLQNKQIAAAYLEILESENFRQLVLQDFPDVAPRSLAFELSPSGYLLTIYVRGADPKRVAEVANAFASHFNDFIEEPVDAESSHSIVRVSSTIEDLELQLNVAIDDRTRFLEANDLEPTEIADLQRRSLDLEFELRNTEVRRESILRQLQSLETSAQRERVAILEAEAEAIDKEFDGVRRSIASTKQVMRELSEVSLEFSALNDKIEELRTAKRSRETLLNNLDVNALWAQELQLNAETAREPAEPVFPLLWLNCLLAALGGLVAGVLYATLLEGIERRRRHRQLEAFESQDWVKPLLPGS